MSNKEKMTIIRSTLKTYSKMTKKIRKSLESAGVEVKHSGSHYFLNVRNENSNTKKVFVLSATSSDWRTGRNLSSEISRFLLA